MKFSGDSFCKTVITSANGQPVPIGTIFCVGRNYRKHIKELNSKELGDPIIFTKPITAICQDRDTIPLPGKSKDIHHEVELALVIGKNGKDMCRTGNEPSKN
jgi:5-carboxymethyl-2-hydroxymuconate isomerase